MKERVLKFKRLTNEAIVPTFACEGDAGFDLYSTEDYVLKPHERYLFMIGLVSEIPSGHCVFIKPKSGLAVKFGIDVLAGVIDTGYRGEWGVLLINLGEKPFEVKKGDKIAQGVLLTLGTRIIEAGEPSETERGTKGFGQADQK